MKKAAAHSGTVEIQYVKVQKSAQSGMKQETLLRNLGLYKSRNTQKSFIWDGIMSPNAQFPPALQSHQSLQTLNCDHNMTVALSENTEKPQRKVCDTGVTFCFCFKHWFA